MKSYKLILVFAVIIFAIVSILWVLGLINQEHAMDMSGKSIGIILILGVSGLALAKVMSVPNSNTSNKDDSKSNQQGPKF